MNLPQKNARHILSGLLALSISCFSGIALAADNVLKSIQYDPAVNGFVVNTAGSAKANMNLVSNGGTGKRLILDIENAEIGTDLPRDQILLRELAAQWVQVRNVTVNQFGGAKPVVRVLMDIDGSNFNVRLKNTKTNQLTLYVEPVGGTRPVVGSATPGGSQVDFQRVINEQRAEIERLRQQLNAPVPGMDDNQSARVQDLNRVVTEQRAEMERRQQQIDMLQTQLNAKPAAPVGISAEEHQNVLHALQEQTRSVNSQRAEISALQSQLAAAQLDLAKLSSAPQTQTGGVPTEQHQQAMTTLMADNEARQRQIAEQQSQLSMQQSQLAERQKQVDTLQAQVNTLREQGLPTPVVPPAAAELEAMKRTLVTMNSKYDAVLSENTRLKAELNAKPATSAGDLSIDLKRMQDANLSLQNQIIRMQEEQSRVKNENTAMRKQIATMQAVAQKPVTADVPQTAEVQRLQAALKNTQTDLNRINLENAQLKNQIANSKPGTAKPVNATGGLTEQQYTVLKNQLDDAKTALGRSVETINRQNQEIARLKNEAERISTSVDVSTRDQITMLNQQLEEKNTQIALLQDQAQTLNVELEKQQSQNRNTVSAEDMASLNRELAAVKTQLNEKDKQVLLLNKQLADAKTALQTPAPIDPMKEAAAAEVKQLREQVARMEDRHRIAVAEFNRQLQAAGETAPLQERIKQLEGQLAESNTRYEKAVRDFNTAQTDSGKAETVKKYEEQVTALTEELNRAQASRKEAEEKLAASEKALTTAKLDLDNALQPSQEIQALRARNEAMERELAGVKEISSRQSEEISTLTDKNKTLQLEISGMHEVSNEAVKTENTALKADLARVLEEKNSLAANFNTQQKTAEDQWQQRVTTLEGDLAALKTQYDELKNKKPGKASSKDMEALQLKYDETTRELVRAKEEAETLRKQVKSQLAAAPAADTNDAEKHYLLGKDFETNGQKDLALEEYRRAAQLAPREGRYANTLSIALAEQKQYGEAIALLTEFLQKDPGNEEVHNQLGKLYLLNDQAEPAKDAFSHAIPINVLNNYAYTLRKLGKTQEAESVFKFALTVSPYDSEVLFNLGTLYNTMNNLEGAKASYTEAIRVKPDFAEAHYNLGLVLSKMGDKPNAVDHLEKFLELEPEAKNAETIRSFVTRLKS